MAPALRLNMAACHLLGMQHGLVGGTSVVIIIMLGVVAAHAEQTRTADVRTSDNIFSVHQERKEELGVREQGNV